MGKKIASLTLFLLLITLVGGITIASAATADSFRKPLATYQIDTNYFGKWLPSYGLYHAGDDLVATEHTPVYPAANGVVVQSKENSQGYGQVIVIQHDMPDGSKVCSVYGHLSRQTGYKMVPLGTVITDTNKPIGYIGSSAENGEGGPHLHFAFVKGAYRSYYEGRATKTGLNAFYNPSTYLNLIRVVNTNDVYKLDDSGRKAKAYSSNVFNSWGWNWNDIRPVTQTELNRHVNSNPSVLRFKDGTFIKMQGGQEISIISGGLRHPFGSWDAYLRYGGKSDQSNVMPVTSYEYNSLHTLGLVYR